MSKIVEIYNFYKTTQDLEFAQDWQGDLFESASYSQLERNELISIFQKETDMQDKLGLAEVLARLGSGEPVTFLVDALSCNDWEIQYGAALTLIVLGQEVGQQALYNFAKGKKEIPMHWFYYDLIEIDNELARNSLRELIRRYPKIAEVAKNASIGRDFLK